MLLRYEKKTGMLCKEEIMAEMVKRRYFDSDQMSQLVDYYSCIKKLLMASHPSITSYLDDEITRIKAPAPYIIDAGSNGTEAHTKASVEIQGIRRYLTTKNVVGLLCLLLGFYGMIVGLSADPSAVEMLVYLGIPVAFIMAIANGANDIANSMGTSVGASALTLKQAILWGSISEFIGAMTMGQFVSKTISKGVLETSAFEDTPGLFALVMFSVLVAAAVTTMVATVYGYPISATHSIIGGVIAAGLAAKGTVGINNDGITKTCIAWVLSPILGMIVGGLLYVLIIWGIFKAAEPRKASASWQYGFIVLTIGISASFIVMKGPEAVQIRPYGTAIGVALAIGVGCALVIALYHKYYASNAEEKVNEGTDERAEPLSVRTVSYSEAILAESMLSCFSLPAINLKTFEVVPDDTILEPSNKVVSGAKRRFKSIAEASIDEGTERPFVPLLILSALSVAFAHGGNDVGNAVGPMGVVWEIWKNPRDINGKPDTETWILSIGACGFVIGIWLLGSRTIETVGTKITTLTPSKSFATQIGAAVAVLASSAFGMPVSTSHCIVGSVVGIAVAQKYAGSGESSINYKVLWKIVAGWLITIPLAMAVAVIIFFAAKPGFDDVEGLSNSTAM